MPNPIVSFVIPTFNRSKYCISQIKAFAKIEGEFEVVISDNSTDKLLLDFISQNPIDERIKHYFTEEKLDMTQNLNRAIFHARGEYLCCIGDDDIIMPNCIEYLKIFKKNKMDIISPTITINYCWPDFSSKYFTSAHQSRLYYKFSKPYILKRESQRSFERALNNCFQGTDNMPKLYHGFVKRNIFEKIKQHSGDYLFGSSPDVSASVLLSLTSKYYFETNIPLTIPGASFSSNTGRAAKKNHIGKLEEENQTKRYAKSWPSYLPRLFTVETVWFHSAILSLLKIKSTGVNLNYSKLYSKIIINNLGSLYQVINYIPKQKMTQKLQILVYLKFEIFKILYSMAKRLLIPTAAGGRKYKSHIKNLEDVVNASRKITPNKNFDFQNCISAISRLR